MPCGQGLSKACPHHGPAAGWAPHHPQPFMEDGLPSHSPAQRWPWVTLEGHAEAGASLPGASREPSQERLGVGGPGTKQEVQARSRRSSPFQRPRVRGQPRARGPLYRPPGQGLMLRQPLLWDGQELVSVAGRPLQLWPGLTPLNLRCSVDTTPWALVTPERITGRVLLPRVYFSFLLCCHFLVDRGTRHRSLCLRKKGRRKPRGRRKEE